MERRLQEPIDMHQSFHYLTGFRAFVVLTALWVAGTGCASTHCTPSTLTGSVADDVFGLHQAACPQNGHAIIETQRSQGRFPCALAVARAKPAQTIAPGGTGQPPLQLVDLRTEEAAYWHTTFTAVPEIREVVVCDTLSTPPGPLDSAAVAHAVARRDAALCLLYSAVASDPGCSALAGVLLDTASSKPLACVRVEAGPEDFESPPPDRPREDLRYKDVDYLVARKLEAQVRLCLAELSARDQRLPGTQPNPWQGVTTNPANVPVIIMPAPPSFGPKPEYRRP